ncbi:MAG: hypothetical protein JST89_13875 [Cyanobacteria bacterium SZAS-4]|nr:hypothetical protein [Cyanobacteria bacterium SZAS-4]
MLQPETFDRIKQKHGHYASWAIWADEGVRIKDNVGDLSIFDDTPALLPQLKPNVVLVGLNISRTLLDSFGNFHDSRPQSQDYKLRYSLQRTSVWGAYMTDIIKDFEEKASGKMMAYLRSNKAFETSNVATFKEELADLGATSPIPIAIGNDAQKILWRNFKDEYDIRVIPHYSQHISKETYREQVGAEILSLAI